MLDLTPDEILYIAIGVLSAAFLLFVLIPAIGDVKDVYADVKADIRRHAHGTTLFRELHAPKIGEIEDPVRQTTVRYVCTELSCFGSVEATDVLRTEGTRLHAHYCNKCGAPYMLSCRYPFTRLIRPDIRPNVVRVR